MRKITEDQENPIDNYNIDFVDKLCPFFKNLNFTPNGITTLSLIFGIISIICLWKKKVVLFAVMYYISYLFDVMDGHYARKYNMTSKGGDMYDHVKDILVIIGVFVTLFKRYRMSRSTMMLFIIFMSIASVLMSAQLGCQEKLYPKDESDTLSFSKSLCVGDPKKTIKFTRYFGCGTWAIFLIVWVLYIGTHEVGDTSPKSPVVHPFAS